MQLSSKQADGASLRDHLLAIPEAVRNDKVRDLLREREIPTRLLYLFDAFIDLARARRSGFAGPEPISYDQIYYWERTIGFPLQPWEVDVIYRIDIKWRNMVRVESEKQIKEGKQRAN